MWVRRSSGRRKINPIKSKGIMKVQGRTTGEVKIPLLFSSYPLYMKLI